MFARAVATATGFTGPVVISSRTVAGNCAGVIGTYIVLNSDGWILTSAQLVNLVRQHQESARSYQDYQGNVVEFRRESGANARSGQTGQAVPREARVRHHSVWWGKDGTKVVDAKSMAAPNLAIGRLEPFDPASVPHYPVIKDPSRGYAPGRSLCKLGYPVHSTDPIFNEDKNIFTLPKGLTPLRPSPLEGIFTRHVHARAPGSGAGNPSLFIETSSPGLIGQTGGSVFDCNAVVWGLQSHNFLYPLGVRPHAPHLSQAQMAHQFACTGLAVHATIIRQFLEAEGIAYQSE